MKKKFFVILATLFLCVSFTACGNSGAGTNNQASSNSGSVSSSAATPQKSNAIVRNINGKSNGYKAKDYNFLREHTSQLKKYVDITGESYKTPEERENAIKKVAEIASEWQEKGDVKEVKQRDTYVSITYSNGMIYIFYPMSSDETSGAVPSDTHVSIYSLQVLKDVISSAGDKETEIAYDAATDGSAAKIADALENFTWDHDLDNNGVTLSEVAHIGQNKVVLWCGHGAYLKDYGPCLLLEEGCDDTEYRDITINYIANDDKYVIAPEFVLNYCDDMTGTFIYLSTCSGLRDNRLVEAFSAKNATAIVANTDVINTIYSCNMMTRVVDQLVAGDNLDKAMAVAKETYGAEDPYFYPFEGAIGHAVPTVYKGGDYQLFTKPVVVFTIKDDNGDPLTGVTLEYSFAEDGDYTEKTTLETDSEGRAFVDVKAGYFSYRLTKEGYEPGADTLAIIPKDKMVNNITETLRRKASGVTGEFYTGASIITELEVPDMNGEFYIAWEAGFRNNPPAGEIRARVDSNTSYYFAAPGETGYIKERSMDEYEFFENLNNSVERLRRGGSGEVGVVMYIENGVATSMLLVVS